jgi:serine/threonine protein kinase
MRDSCPKPAELQKYLLGQLSGGDFDVIDSHLSLCPHCSQTILDCPRPTDKLTNHLSRLPDQSDFGDYELLVRLGRGGMGQVYRARHRVLHLDFAVKIIRPELQDDSHFAARFQREVQCLSEVKSPHVVSPVHAGRFRGAAFLVMELVDGCDLEAVVREHGVLAPADAAEIVAQVLLGLTAIHAAGLVHRDLHPGNVMLSRDGLVKITDFGLVRMKGAAEAAEAMPHPSLTDARDRLGATAFSAPEQQFAPNTAGPAADYFSLGCLWYFLLTGRSLPRDPVSQQLTRLDESLALLPRRCRPILRELLSDSPGERMIPPPRLRAQLMPLRRKAKLAELHCAARITRGPRNRPRAFAFCCLVALGLAASLAMVAADRAELSRDHSMDDRYHQRAGTTIAVPYLQEGAFARQYFYEAFPGRYTIDFVDTHDGMLSKGRLITFWYFDCVGNPEEALIAEMDGSPRPTKVVELIPGTHKVGIWSARNDVWEGEKRKVFDRASVIFYVYPDLEIGPLQLPSGPMQQGERVDVSFEIRNRGTVTSNVGTVRAFLNAGRSSRVSGMVAETQIPALKPDETHSAHIAFRIPGDFPPGEAFVSVLVDADDTTLERDELEVATWPAGKVNGFRFITEKDPKGVPSQNNYLTKTIRVSTSR